MTASQTSPTRKSPKFYAAIIGAAVLIIGVAVAGWLLMRDDEQTSQGVCNNRAYELSVEPSDGQLEVSFELQSMAPDEVWTVQIEQDGQVILQGDWTTDTDAEIDVDTYAQPEDGNEFTVGASNEAGDVCAAVLRR